MGRSRLSKLLTHPFFAGLVITAALAFLFMPDIGRYRVEVIEKHGNSQNTNTWFADLDHDESYERIRILDTPAVLNIMLYKGDAFIEQFNLRSSPVYPDYIHMDDYNNDGSSEIYLLTYRNDSILLSILDPLIQKEFLIKERLVYHNDTISFKDEVPTCRFVGLLSSGDHPDKDPVFVLLAGFNKQPRNFFRYHIRKDELKSSPLCGVSFGQIFVEDLDSDSQPEIYFNTRATGNHDPGFPYSDQSAWLMVLDENLEYVFDPIEFPKYPTSLTVTPFLSGDSGFIVALHHYCGLDSIPSSLNLYDHKGRLIRTRPVQQIEMGGYYLSSTKLRGRPVICLLDASNSKVTYLDEDLEAIHTFTVPDSRYTWLGHELDVDFDGAMEKISLGRKTGTFVIFRENFRHALVVDLGETELPGYLLPFKIDGAPYLHVQYTSFAYLLAYRSNPLYCMKYPLLMLFYLAVSLLVLMIYRLQKYRAEQVYQAKKKMNELQILSLKNQIEPHFTFNILNAIGSLYSGNTDRDLAYNLFVKYSNLLRVAIQNSNKVSISIKEELEFVNTFVELEQFRSGQPFNYQVDIAEGVDLTTRIPRMLIHTFVENAIKYGIRMVPKNALLKLIITRNKASHQILILDNGPGLNAHPDPQPTGNQNSPDNTYTGKGLQIIDEMLDLFYQLEGVRINFRLKDLSARGSADQGTEVQINIPG